MTAKKPWGGRFAQATNRLVEEFTESLSFDRRLYAYDICGSIAHCRMLARQEIIPDADAERIIAALREIRVEIDRGELEMSPTFEDIHMRIEARLIEKVGSVGGKLHTARSRNDQVALDMSLYLRDEILALDALLEAVQVALVDQAQQARDVFLPGFTHLQHAQPVYLAHHLLAYGEMFGRDRQRLQGCFERVDRLPLGAGAMAGTPYPIDRAFVAGLLGYSAVTANSMDTVSDRDGMLELCSSAAIVMMHLSRLCEELVLWASPEFGFVRISDAFCTGSSIMPQKKNPDIPELVRGKTGRVYGNLVSLLTIMKALPLCYNRDLQEDKPALFDTVDTTRACLEVVALMIPELGFDRDAMAAAARSGYLTATDLADYLAGKGMPFRNAHEVVGQVVAHCEERGCMLEDLSLEELRGFSPLIGADALARLDTRASIDSRTSAGGTAAQSVRRQIRQFRTRLRRDAKRRDGCRTRISSALDHL